MFSRKPTLPAELYGGSKDVTITPGEAKAKMQASPAIALDNIGDLCDACPDFSNLNGAACGTTIAQLRDPALGRRSLGQRVTISVAHVTAVKSNGFYIRDAGGRDYAGIFLFMNPVRQGGG